MVLELELWLQSPAPYIATTFPVFLNIFCHESPHCMFPSRLHTQPRAPAARAGAEASARSAHSAPQASYLRPAALLSQRSGNRTPLQLSSVLVQSAMERHKTPFICPLL